MRYSDELEHGGWRGIRDPGAMRPPDLRALLPGLLVLAVLLGAPRAEPAVFTDPGFVSELVVGLPPYTPVGLAFAPDGRLFVWQKDGLVRIVRDGVLLSTPFVDLRDRVNRVVDRGLLGVAVDPAFATTGHVYLLYTYEAGGNPDDPAPKTARLTRVTADFGNRDVALAGSEVVLLGTLGTAPCRDHAPGADCIPADFNSHTIGTVRVAPDGTLFVGSGDAASSVFPNADALRAQDLDSAAGKLLRIRPDGTAPADNPFYDGTHSIRSKVWAYGLRNPYRFALDPAGLPYVGDAGWEGWEEINRGRGANFGWPCYEGPAPQVRYQAAFAAACRDLPAAAVTPPLFAYDYSEGGAAVIAGAFYTATQYPEAYRGTLFVADYVRGWIRRLVLRPDGTVSGLLPFAEQVGGPVHVELGPDGLLYYIDFPSGEVRRIRFAGPLAVASADPTSGYPPLTVAFSSAGSHDTGGGALSYHWDFGDGATATEAHPVHTYAGPGVATYTARLTVTNPQGLSASATVLVTVGSRPPVPAILSPAAGTVVAPGERVHYRGHATDPDEGPLAAERLRWTILLHHDDHVHTFAGGEGGTGTFEVQEHGAGTFRYELVLTATDASGLSSTSRVSLPVQTLFWMRLNGASFGPGDRLEVDVGARHAGPLLVVDVYAGVLLPDGQTAVFLAGHPPVPVIASLAADPRRFPALVRAAPVPAGTDVRAERFLSHTFTGTEPPGGYLVFGAVVVAGALDDGRLDPGELLVLVTRPFAVPP